MKASGPHKHVFMSVCTHGEPFPQTCMYIYTFKKKEEKLDTILYVGDGD